MDAVIDKLKRALLPETLFGRSLLIIAVPILVLQFVVTFTFFNRHWDTMSDKLVLALSGEIQMVVAELSDTSVPRTHVERVIRNAEKTLNLKVSTARASPEGLTPSDPSFQRFYWFSTGQKLEEQLRLRLGKPFAVYPYKQQEKLFEIVVEYAPGKIARFICSEKKLTSITTYIFILWMIGSALILLAVAVAFMRNQIRPILRLALAAEKIGKGQDVPDFKPVGASEVRRASRAFIVMKERLKRQIEQRTAMLSGVSHDLRTPLTRMKLQLAMMSGPDAEHLKTDIADMERMIDGYLAFARGEGDETAEPTDLKAMLERLVQNARRAGQTIETGDIECPQSLRLRPVAVERALSNIISNAGKFASKCRISSRQTIEYLDIIIEDDGPGIAPDMAEDVFRPFFRVEKSRNQKTGGIGLGLSIAQDVVHSHGGEIVLEKSASLGGLKVVIRLPL